VTSRKPKRTRCGAPYEALEAGISRNDELLRRSGARWSSVSRAWLDARDRRDLDTLAALTHEHAVWESPVDGMLRGRTHVVEQVQASFVDSDTFSSQLLSFEQRGDRAVAIVRNTGRRDGEELDSRQALHFEEQDGLVALVRIAVDDPKAVAEFWAG